MVETDDDYKTYFELETEDAMHPVCLYKYLYGIIFLFSVLLVSFIEAISF